MGLEKNYSDSTTLIGTALAMIKYIVDLQLFFNRNKFVQLLIIVNAGKTRCLLFKFLAFSSCARSYFFYQFIT